MKRAFFHFIGGLSLIVMLLITGCASGPKLGAPTELQQILNRLDAVPLPGGNSVKFEFGGDTWIARVNGENFMAGTFSVDNTYDGSILTLKQTHTWSGAAGKAPGATGAIAGSIGRQAATWVKTPGPDIVLEYKAGPPATLSAKE